MENKIGGLGGTRGVDVQSKHSEELSNVFGENSASSFSTDNDDGERFFTPLSRSGTPGPSSSASPPDSPRFPEQKSSKPFPSGLRSLPKAITVRNGPVARTESAKKNQSPVGSKVVTDKPVEKEKRLFDNAIPPTRKKNVR